MNLYIKELENHRDIVLKDISIEKQQTSFLKQQPLIVDIGCGNGTFICKSAQAYPHYNYIGIELKYKRLVLAARKCRNIANGNIYFFQCRGENLEKILAKNSVAKVYINFPDPWAKKKQKKHRLLQEHTIKKIINFLYVGGEILFKTDHREYFLSSLEILNKFSSLQIISYTEDLHKSIFNMDNICTEFENLFTAKKFPIFFVQLKKIDFY